MGFPGGWELIVILLVVILLFGAKKIPDLAKGLGTGIREFKKATKEQPGNEKLEEKPDTDEKQNKDA